MKQGITGVCDLTAKKKLNTKTTKEDVHMD